MKTELNLDLLNVNSCPIYENINKYNLMNKYRTQRNYYEINNYNNIIYKGLIKDKKLEYNNNLKDNYLKSNEFKLNYSYKNKMIAQINNEIIKFKDKMNKDKKYLNNIQNKLFSEYDITDDSQKIYNESLSEENMKYRKRAHSLTNRVNCYKNYININGNINYELNDYYNEKRKIKNNIINNDFIDRSDILKKNLGNFQESNYKVKKKDNDLSKNIIINNLPKRSNSFISFNNNIINKIILNNTINKNNYLENKDIKNEKEFISNNKLKNIKEYKYNRYPELKNVESNLNSSIKKYLTIQLKNDKEKQIKLNSINTLNNNFNNNNNDYNCNILNNKNYINSISLPNNENNKIKKDITKFQTRKYDKFINNIINENSKDNSINNYKNKKCLINYENIKKKYINNKNDLSCNNNKNFYRKRSSTYIKDDKKEQELIPIINKNTSNNIGEKHFEDINLKNIKKKYSDNINNEKKIDSQYNTYNTYNFNSISSFSIFIEKKVNKNKDILIKNLNKKILELENQLKTANLKVKDLIKIIEDINNKNKILYIDKINSFNYIEIKNHFIKLSNSRNINIKKNNNYNKLNNNLEKNPNLKKSKSYSEFINTSSDNEHHSYTSFDNYKNMNIYFRKITTFIDDKKIKKIKPNSLRKFPLKYKKILFNKKSIKKESLKNNITINKNLKINEKMIYTLYCSTDEFNILLFDPDSKKFSIQKFKDIDNFKENFQKNLKINNNSTQYNNGNIFLYNEGFLYVITGKDYNIFYKFNPYKKEINKLCKLKYNHSNGNLIYYDQRIFCLSGDFNKKVECYIEQKNEWIEIPELLTERSNFSTCIIKEQYLFVLFGYNNINKKYLNSIEFIDLLCENSKWKYLYYENSSDTSLYLTRSLVMNYDDKKIIIFGGYDGKNNSRNNLFYQINLKKNFDEERYDISDDNLSNIIKIGKGLEFNNKNKFYFFDFGYNKYFGDNNNWIYISFDSEFNIHIININTFSHEIINYN